MFNLKLKKLFAKIKIKEDFVIVHSNLVPFNKFKFTSIRDFWDQMNEYFDFKKTIIMPTFTFNNAAKNLIWDYYKTKSETGALTEFFRKKIATRRTLHPLHSVAIFGPKAKEIPEHRCKSSFGRFSTWEWLALNKNVCNLSLGIGLEGGATICHYSEEKIGVPYRKYIKLKAIVKNKNGKKEKKLFKYYARFKKKETNGVNYWRKCENDLINSKILKKILLKDIIIQKMNTYEATKFIIKNLRKNPYYLGRFVKNN